MKLGVSFDETTRAFGQKLLSIFIKCIKFFNQNGFIALKIAAVFLWISISIYRLSLPVALRRFAVFFVALFFCLNFLQAQIFSWNNPNLEKDSLRQDSILAARMNREYFVRDTASIIRTGGSTMIVEEAAKAKNDRDRFLGDLNASGAIIRGVSFGNNQGSSVQSSMDLQLSGRLSPEVSILASISDHNLPIQADGYTQSLAEFDKIYIQLNIKKNTMLRGGHLDLLETRPHFARYQRRSMGLEFQTNFGKENRTFAEISAGVARSEFHRIRFQGIEDNQGPYRLTGKNGENFITILSGSEEVFIDGVPMRRGEDADYTINYNTGEITFTSFRPIYRQNFITIAYNYANRNYNRYLITGNLRHERQRLKLGLHWFLENDNKNAPLSLNLSKQDEQILANAGSDENLMFAPSAELAEFSADKILYAKRSGAAGDFFEYSTDAGEPLYSVAFTYFGQHRGDYRIKQSLNNGRIFEFVGKGLGDYSAVRKLPAPQKSQVFSADGVFTFEGGKIGADVSLSNRDLNLFSAKNNDENLGYAARIFGDKIFRRKDWQGTSSLEYQHISQRFHILDRINSVEFARDFNLANEFNGRTQNRLIFNFLNLWQNQHFLNYRLNFLDEKDFYQGFKNDLEFGWRKNRIATHGKLSHLSTKSPDVDTKFTRGNLSAEYFGQKGSWAIGGSLEHNIKEINQLKITDATSFSWREIFAQKKIGDSARTKLLSRIYLRSNDSVRENRLQHINNIFGLMAESQLIKTEKATLSALAHYRKIIYKKAEFSNGENQDFVVGNVNYHQQLFRNGMRFQAFYELGNGQEAQREFQYVKVTDGKGVYKWTDYNADGVQQLDEFEVAEFSDLAQYIRIYTNSVRYLPSNKNKLQLSLFVNPAVVFSSENAFLKRWQLNLSLTSQNSFLKKNRVLAWNPFEREASQILKNQSFLASLNFNPSDLKGWNGSYRFTANDNLINANFSQEENRRALHFLNLGYAFSEDFRLDFENSFENVNADSELFSSRNYRLENWESRPKITYRFTNAFQAEALAAYRNRGNQVGAEKLKAWEATGTVQWQKNRSSVRGSFSFISNAFHGTSFSIVGNQMLDGLQPGKNAVWNVYLQQAINSFINLNLSYDGRNSGERTIHTGSVQIRASF